MPVLTFEQHHSTRPLPDQHQHHSTRWVTHIARSNPGTEVPSTSFNSRVNLGAPAPATQGFSLTHARANHYHSESLSEPAKHSTCAIRKQTQTNQGKSQRAILAKRTLYATTSFFKHFLEFFMERYVKPWRVLQYMYLKTQDHSVFVWPSLYCLILLGPLGIEPSMFGYTPPEVPAAGAPYDLAGRRIRLAGGWPKEIMPVRGPIVDKTISAINEGVPHDSVGVRLSVARLHFKSRI
jgi:hypothetical protein